VGLGLPDFRAAERTFQVLTQVAGRAGRGLLGGRVVLQTYNPDHYAIQAAAKHDYADFFAREMRYRKDLGYPPFRRLMRMVYRHPDSARAEAEANVVARQLLARIKDEKVTATDLPWPARLLRQKIPSHQSSPLPRNYTNSIDKPTPGGRFMQVFWSSRWLR
jgi:primosomal protein N' (replication factor Y)